jgi:hypothetical protein
MKKKLKKKNTGKMKKNTKKEGSTLSAFCTTTKKKARECTSCSQLPVKRPH